MNIIVAVDKQGGIGRNNRLLYRIHDDMMRFKRLTTTKAVIMGRKTFESIGRPLPNRVNYIMTRKLGYEVEGCIMLHSIDDIKNEVMSEFSSEDIFVIGGGEIYKMLLPYCDTIYLTVTDIAFGADTFFPEINPDEWSTDDADISDRLTDEDTQLSYRYITYHRIKNNEEVV